MKYEQFFGECGPHKYHLDSYFYRIEFQARGAPHVHSLLWLKNAKGEDAPSFWSENEEDFVQEDDYEKAFDQEQGQEKEREDIENMFFAQLAKICRIV